MARQGRRLPCHPVQRGPRCVAQIEEAAGCPVLSMVGVAIEETVRRGWRHVGVLGFRSAPAVYTWPLGDRGIACVEIDGTRQARLDAAIRAVMEGRNGEDETDVARSAVTALRAARVDGVVLGCTEIPLLLGEEAEAPDLVSPLSLLAESAVRFAVGDGARN